MKIERIRLINFRKFDKLELEFQDGINNIYGGNGSGKTSVLEAIAYLSIPRSFRGDPDKYLIKWGRDFFNIRGDVLSDTHHHISITYSLSSGKKISIDGKRIKKYSQLMDTFLCMAFSTRDYYLIDGEPENRRKFFDRMISLMDYRYFLTLIRYKKVLRQKNIALKKGLPVEIWNRQLEDLASYIIRTRKEVVQRINQLLNGRYEIAYVSSLDGRSYRELLDRERSAGFTLAGPHRDDFLFFIDNRPMKYYASEGERRLFYLQLIIALREIIRERTGKEPVMVMDEPGNVLDKESLSKFLQSLKGQVILANLEPLEGANNIHLENLTPIENPL